MNSILKKYYRTVEQINQKFLQLHNLSNDELRKEFKRIASYVGNHKSVNDALEKKLVDVFSIIKETARRFSIGNVIVTANENDISLAENFDFITINGEKAYYKNTWDIGGVPFEWNMVHYDEQLLGGILLHYGYAVEMATGEGKTLMATLPVALNALTYKGVHLMTVNKYLSQRDYKMTRPIYMFHGLKVDCIEEYSRSDKRRKSAYHADITFGTNSSFTFDYLFDHLSTNPEECVQDKHSYSIIDELDSILIDNAEIPHIISGGNYHMEEKAYKENLPIVKELIASDNKSKLYKFSIINKRAEFTKKGMIWLARKKEIPNLYSTNRIYQIENYDKMSKSEQEDISNRLYIQNVLYQLLLALTVYERDVDYIIEDQKIKIIDQNTGRVLQSNRWEHGLHTAIEVKEDVKVQPESDGMAVISLKNYFRLYDKIAGMSGTIMTVQKELNNIYGLKCAALPTHKPVIRKDLPLRIYHTTELKDKAIADQIQSNKEKGRPTLIGCLNLRRSDHIANILEERDLEFNRLDARNTADEAMLVSKAGIGSTITVSTSIAGRGTDIKPSDDALKNGGLMVIGTDLFNSVRIDNQLKGRSGRQGNPGSSVFFASLEDDILKYLSNKDRKEISIIGESVKDSKILRKMVLPFFIKAQNKRETISRRIRKQTTRKDDIISPHRRKYYEQRNTILFEPTRSDAIIREIIRSSHISMDDVNSHLMKLYEKAKKLIDKTLKNNPETTSILIPFSHVRQPFTIKLAIEKVKNDSNYFHNEFKRQSILQLHDKYWKDFVIYIMTNLDNHEIELLDDKYAKMKVEINRQIIDRLTKSTILFDEQSTQEGININTDGIENENEKEKEKELDLNEPCPCGSGKKFCECHGKNKRRKKTHRR